MAHVWRPPDCPRNKNVWFPTTFTAYVDCLLMLPLPSWPMSFFPAGTVQASQLCKHRLLSAYWAQYLLATTLTRVSSDLHKRVQTQKTLSHIRR